MVALEIEWEACDPNLYTLFAPTRLQGHKNKEPGLEKQYIVKALTAHDLYYLDPQQRKHFLSITKLIPEQRTQRVNPDL